MTVQDEYGNSDTFPVYVKDGKLYFDGDWYNRVK